LNNLRALIFDPDTCLQGPQNRQIENITLCPAASTEELTASVAAGTADLIMVDMELPQGVNWLTLVAELRKQKPGIPVILLTGKTPTEKDWMSAALASRLQVMQTPVSDSEMMYHITRLFPTVNQTAQTEVAPQPVEQLRNEHGRLDANLVSEMFDITMTDVAANVGISRQALGKTPDSLNIQSALHHFERVASNLFSLTGSEKGLKMWLHSSNKRFDKHTPLEIIKLGKVAMLADWADDARLGNPQ
jgi:CheY-like chemotaxis protein